MSGKVSDLPIRSKRALFRQKKLDRINFRSGKRGRVLRNPPGVTTGQSVGVTRCWSLAWSHDSLSHDKIADPVILSIFAVQLLMFVQVVTFMRDLRWFQCYHLVSM